MIPVKILERDLEDTIRKLARQEEEVFLCEDSLSILKEDVEFNTRKIAELKTAIEKLSATKL